MVHPLRRFLRARLDPAQRYGLRLTLAAAAIALAGIPFAWLLQQVVAQGPLVGVDAGAAQRLHEIVSASPTAVALLELVSFLGKPLWFYVLVGGAVIVLWLDGLRRLAVYLVATDFAGGAIDTVVKEVVNRSRPAFDDPVATAFGHSFPSGHAMMSLVVYGSLVLVFVPAVRRRLRGPLIAGATLLVLAIGFSRLALGVHFLSDVLAGYVLGLAWLAASTAAFSIWRVERGLPPVHAAQGVEPEAAPAIRHEDPPPDGSIRPLQAPTDRERAPEAGASQQEPGSQARKR